MKRNFKILVIAAFLAVGPIMMLAQNPPHPNGGAAPGSGTNTPVGGGASLGDGVFILVTLAASYAGRKIYLMRKATAVTETE